MIEEVVWRSGFDALIDEIVAVLRAHGLGEYAKQVEARAREL